MATAKPHPVVMTIQPEPCALDLLSSTAATTPSPSSTSKAVPINSAVKVLMPPPLAASRDRDRCRSRPALEYIATLRDCAPSRGLKPAPGAARGYTKRERSLFREGFGAISHSERHPLELGGV